MKNRVWLFVSGCLATKVFKWDVQDLEQVFCANSKKAFLDLNANQLSNIEASQVLKTGRHKWTMWPWEIADSFEGECIEETCTQSEVVEFCSRSDQNIDDKLLNKKLNSQRMERYRFCETHVEKRVNATKQIDYSKKEDKNSNDRADIWRKELSPDRLFRGWWEELKKAYTRFCLQDKSDCARKCDVEHGTCNLWEDESVNEDDKDRWKYRCECDPGYGPSVMVDPPVDGSQYLCRSKIDQEESGKCETLQTLNAQNEKVRVNPDMLDEGLKIGQAKRKRRMAGHYTAKADNYFFPATVDIFHSTVSLKKGEIRAGDTKSDTGIYAHRCGGTLIWPNTNRDRTNIVLTAAHCFCFLDNDLKKLHDHFFVRIGLIDNKQALNMTSSSRPAEGTQYIDVRVKEIKFADPAYITEKLCQNTNFNGKSDLATMVLSQSVDFTDMSHVKPACNYAYQEERRKPSKDYMLIDNENCYVSGWGRTENDKGSLGISQNLKYGRVTVVRPEKCKDLITESDDFVQNMERDRNQVPTSIFNGQNC